MNRNIMNKTIYHDIKYIINNFSDWTRLKNKTVLITGANGFLPAYIVETLVYLSTNFNLDIRVLALVRNYNKASVRFSHILNSPFLNILQHDISGELELTDDVHFIIHAASQASPKYYFEDPVGTLSANSIGTYHLLKFATRKNVEAFLFFSSSEVYGNILHHEYLNERDFGESNPTDLRACYSESKRMGETMCIAFHHQYKVPVKIVRIFHTYGPGLNLDDGRVFADFVCNIVQGNNITLNSDGSAVRSFCYISDATIGFFKILLNGKDGETYNLGNPNATTSILDLAKTLISLFPERYIKLILNVKESENYLKSSINRVCPNIDKIKSLGWIPTINITEGFTRTIKSFENE